MEKNQKSESIKELKSQKILGIPAFFVVRAGGWFLLAVTAAVFSFAWEFTIGYPTKSFTILTLVLVGLFCWKGAELIYIAKHKHYFTRVLTCQDVGLSNVTSQIKNFVNPTSQTPFRISKQTSFISDDGMKVTFTFDRNRKFQIGAKYMFYFRNPTCGMDELTAEQLEYLKIDHAIVSIKNSN